ncbi:MAG: hypothetical protein ACRDKI_03160 [Solirubrobacterales bacterium]
MQRIGLAFAVMMCAIVFPALAGATQSASTFDADPFKPTGGGSPYVCVMPAGGASSIVSSLFFSDTPSDARWQNLSWTGTTCTTQGQLRIAIWEKLTVAGQQTYVMRGGGGSNQADPTGIKFGHVRASDLASQPGTISSQIPGNVGSPAASCPNTTLYINRPEIGSTGDLSNLYYKPFSSGSKWDNYGAQPGTNNAYDYMLWTWPREDENSGAGQIRAVIPSGQYIRPCDVDPVYMPMYPANSNVSAGRVKLMYGRVNNGAETVYGWFMVAWQYNNAAWHFFVQNTAQPISSLLSGGRLNAGQSLYSPNGQYHLTMQTDGNLVWYGPAGCRWQSITYTGGDRYAVMQNDGNLVVYNGSASPLWNSLTFGQGPTHLDAQDDGNLVTYRNSGGWTWQTNDKRNC